MMYSRQKIFSVVWLCAVTLLLVGQKQLFAQTIQSNYGIPDYINVANGAVTFKVKIIGAATSCSAATLDITLPPGHMFVNGSAVLENSPGSSGIIADTSSAAEANSRRLWINNIPQFPGVTELSFKVYANCSGIGVNNPNINYVLSGCTATPATLSSGMITRNAQLNITQVTNNNMVGPVDTVYERKITLRNDGYGTIDTFYIDSRNQNSLQVVSYTADAGATVSLTKIMAGTDTIYRYKIIKPGSLSNGQTFSITEQVKIVNCSGSYLTAIKSWYGINGQECSAVSNNINAGAILASRTSSMAIARIGTFAATCRGDVVSDTLVLRNNGTNNVINPDVAFSGYNSTSGSIFSWNQSTNASLGGTLNYAINPSTIKYKAKINGVWQAGWSTLTADSSLAVGTAGIANSCFGANDKIAVWSHMPFTMIPNDSVLYVIEGRQCTYTACSEDATAVTRLDARFRSACGDVTTAVGAGTSYTGRLELQPTDFPLDVVPGETFSLGYYVPSIGHIAPQLFTNGQVSFTIDLPAQFNWTGNLADISFFKGTTNLLSSGSVSYSGNPGGVITFTFTPVTSDNYYIGTSFEIRNVTVDPTLVTSSSATVGNGVVAKRKTVCPELQLFCTNKTIMVKAGPGTCPQGGLSVGRIQTRRTNYGAPDALNNGTVNGSLDMNKVKTKYVMTGDTLEVTYWGRVLVTGLSPVFNTGGVTSTYSLHVNKMQPLKSIVSLFNSSAAQVGTTAEETLSFGSGSTANQSSVSFGIADFNEPARTAFLGGDSVVVKKYFRILPQNAVTDNDNSDFIQQVVLDNNVVYLGNSGTPALKYSCGEPLRQWFNMVSLRIASAEAGTRNAVACTELDYTLRLNAFVGGSGAPFIFEQRKVFEVSQVRYQYPAGLTYNGTTAGGTPVNAAANPLVYNGPFTSYPAVTDESRVNLNLVKPSMRIDGCLVTLPLGPIVSAIDYKKYPDFNTVRTIDLSNTVNSIVKPTLTMTSPLPDLYTSTDSISWVVRLAVTGGANSSNTFLGKSGTSGISIYNIQRVANISAATGTNLTKVGDVFQAGAINNGTTNFFRVFATTAKCEKDTLQLAYGWDCAGYPATVSAASCKQTFNLSVTPYNPALQLNVIAQGNGTAATAYTLCDTLEYELEVTNSGLGLAHDLAVQMQLPATGGLVFVPGSFALQYPLSQPAFTMIDDSNVQSLSSSLFSFNIPDNNLPDLSTAGKYRIKFKVTFNSCSFSGGSRITFRPVGMKNCQQSVLGTGQSAQRIVLSDAPELIPSFTFTSTVDSTTACVAGGASTLYRFKLTNNTFTTTGNDGFRITLPDNWVMDTGTISFLNGNVTGATLDTILPGNIYDFNIGSGLASTQSVQFTAVLNNTTALACGNLDTIEETGFVQFNAVCAAKGLDCTIKQLHETDHNTTIYTQRPAYSIGNFTAQAGTLPNHLVGAVTIANANTAYIAQNGTLRLYKDVNNNGVRDNGDILLGTQSYPLANLASQTFNYDFTGYVGQVCPLLAVFESCACDTPTAVKPGCDIILKSVADLSLTKTANNMTPIVGSNVIFTLVLSNAGPNVATGVSVKDVLSSGYTYVTSSSTNGTYNNASGLWTLTDTVPTASSDTLHIEATVKATGNYTNYAQVFTANEEDPDSTPGDDSNNQDDDDSVTPVPNAVADLSLVKAVNNMTPMVGSNVIFTLALSNTGPSAATGVSVKDLLSSGYTFVNATSANGNYNSTTGIWTLANSLNAGASDTIRIEATVKASGNYTNYAQVFTANEEDPDSTPGDDSNNQDDDDSVTPVPVPVADLSLAKTVSNMAPIVGSNVIFTLTLSNAGPSAASGVSVKDILSNGYTFVSATATNGTYNNTTGIWTLSNPLANAASDTLHIEATVNATGNYTNYAQVFTANEEDPDSTPGDDSNNDDDDDNVTPVPVPVADLSIVKAGPASVNAGESFSYTLTISNAGPSEALNFTVKDPVISQFAATGISCNVSTLPGTGTCPATLSLNDLQGNGITIPSLKKDGVLTLTLTGTAGSSAQQITNIAYVTPATGTQDPDTANNSDTAITRTNSSLAGNVYNDVNGLNGLPANTVNGTGTNVNNTLYVHLVNNSNTVVATQPVQANGSYNFPGVATGTYSLVLNTSAQPSAIPSLANTWVNTGENLGSGPGSDGQADGMLSLIVGNTNINNANFGIEQPPTATDATMASRTNPGGNLYAPVSPSVFVTADPAPGAVWFIRLTAFPANANNILVGGTAYNAASWPANGITMAAINGQPLLPVEVDPIDSNTTVTLPYVSVDQAGKTSDTAIASVPFHTITISGNVFNDINGLNGSPANTVDGAGISFSGLYAVLTDVITDTVMARVPVSATDGSYSFAGMDAGAFSVRITTQPSTTGGLPPAVALPATWLHTGEHLGAGAGNDGFADGILYIGIKDVDVIAANFGIEQPPVATSDTAAGQVNPGGNISVTVPPATFVTSDPAPGAVTTIVIYSLPSNANSITIGSTTYTAGNPLPPGGVSIPVNAAGQPLTPISVDPVNGAVTVGINYYATDEAGKQSDTATAYLPFSTISITGTVYHDANGLLGQPANTIDGTGTNAGNLKAVLVRNNNNTIAAVTDVAANGTFAFDNINAGDYRVVITTTVNGNQNPAILLPSGWVHTGEYTGTGAGNDGAANGSVDIGNVTENVSGIRFGIEQLPEAYDIPASFQLNPGGTATVAVSTLGGNDPEDGTKGSGNTFIIVTLPAQTQGTLYYNGQAVVAGDTLHNYNPSLLTVDPVDGNASVNFQYSVVDTAGFADQSPAMVTMNFIPVPMSGTVFHDANGIMDNTVNGTGQGQPSGTQLYANLVDPQTNEVIASVAVNANGSYQFGTVRPGDTLSVQISTQQGIAGQAAPAVQLPQNWVATGEHTGTGMGHDNQPDGTQLVYTGVDYNGVSQVNFGIEQPPVADEKTLNIPSAGLNVAYPLGAMPLSGTDPEDGSYGTGSSNFIFGQQPACCGIITYNGVVLNPGDMISNYTPALLAVTFTDIMAQQVIFTYGVTDAAGKPSPLVNYIINTGTILPVDWQYFTAKAEGSQARLEWSTAREQNNTGFDIERSGDAITFTKIGHEDSKAVNGNSNSPLAYVSYDAAPLNGINYYRLKQTDIDGQSTYSEVRPVTFGHGEGSKISVYPNPATDKVYVQIADPSQVKELRLLSVDGRVLYRSDKEQTSNIDMSVYATGTFIIQVELKNGTVSNFNIVKR